MMDGKSLNITVEKKAQLKQLFPDVFSEDKIDWERLRLAFGEEVFVQGEHYELSWAGKAEARQEIQKQTTATLTPDLENSVNFETSDNIFIAGENLDVLRILQKSYFGKVKMIYIDPPYNTGNDSFVYPDDYAERREEYERRAGIADERGFLNKQDLWKKNSKENGQFHSVWLSMMYPRLYLARNLLREDGVMFVSIDDNEAANLKLLMDEIFGQENYLTTLTIKVRYEGKTLVEDKDFQKLVEHILVYAKNSTDVILRKPETKYDIQKFEWHIIEKGTPKIEKMGNKRVEIFKHGDYDIIKKKPSQMGLKEIWATGKILDGNSSGRFFRDYLAGRYKLDGLGTLYKVYGIGDDDFAYRYFTGPKKEGATKGKYYQGIPKSILKNLGNSTKSQPITTFFDLADSFGNCRHEGGVDFRSGKKPLLLLRKLFEMINLVNDDIILDFFAGSGTTAQAILELNQEDGGNRKFILIQLPEALDESSEAFKAGYKTIADISRARIKKVVEKLDSAQQEELDFGGAKPDLGFKAYTLDYSNFKVWRSDVENQDALLAQMDLLREPLADYRGDNAALLTELCLKAGLPLSIEVQERHFEGCRIYDLGQGTMWLALDRVNLPLFRHVADAKPSRFVTLGNLFSGENADETMSNATLQMQDAGVEFKII